MKQNAFLVENLDIAPNAFCVVFTIYKNGRDITYDLMKLIARYCRITYSNAKSVASKVQLISKIVSDGVPPPPSAIFLPLTTILILIDYTNSWYVTKESLFIELKRYTIN